MSGCLHPVSVWRSLFGMMLSMSAIVPGSRLSMRSLLLRLNAACPLLVDRDLVSWGDGCLRDLRWWSDDSHLLVGLPLGDDHPDLFLFSDTLDQGWGAALGDLLLSGLWCPLCSRFSINQRELLAILYAVQGFLPYLRGRSVAVYSDNSMALAYLRKQGHSLVVSERGCSGTPLRVSVDSSPSPAHSWPSECSGGFAQPPLSSPRLRVDDMSSGCIGAPASVAGHHRALRDISEPSPAGVFLTHVRPTVSWHGCDVCSRGTACRPTPSFPSAFFLGCWRRFGLPGV